MSNTRIAGALENEMSVTSQQIDIDARYYNNRSCKPDDYVELIESQTGQVFGACEIQGWRKTQEDRLCVSVEAVKGFEKLSFEEQEAICLETFSELQEKHGGNVHVGSTACMAAAWVDHHRVLRVLTANLGDSSAYVVILNGDNQLVNHERINLLHKPTDEAERERIFHNGGFVRESRLNYDLSLSRAFGDTRFENTGISHIPDVSLFNYPLADGERAYVVVACDGMDNIANRLGSLVSENSHQSLAHIANQLVGAALTGGSGDNISAVIFMPGPMPASAAVFDGHGGSIVAKNVSNNFYPVLSATAAKVKELEWYAETRARIEKERISRQLAIYESKQKKERNLDVIKNKFESHLAGVTSSAEFEIFMKLVHSTDLTFTAPREYVLVFQACTQYNAISDLEVLAAKYEQKIYYWGLYSQERKAGKRQYIASFSENEEIPASFDAFMTEALQLLAGRGLIQLAQQDFQAAPRSPRFFDIRPPVKPDINPDEYSGENEAAPSHNLRWLL